ncbi:hypothetical protein V1523DRAFT_114768 [Lipomyces doorenjongii]
MRLVIYFLLFIFAISSNVVAVPVRAHEYDTLCLVQINPTQGAPYYAPGSFWMVVYAELDTVYRTMYVSKDNIIYGKQNHFSVFVPLALT